MREACIPVGLVQSITPPNELRLKSNQVVALLLKSEDIRTATLIGEFSCDLYPPPGAAGAT